MATDREAIDRDDRHAAAVRRLQEKARDMGYPDLADYFGRVQGVPGSEQQEEQDSEYIDLWPD